MKNVKLCLAFFAFGAGLALNGMEKSKKLTDVESAKMKLEADKGGYHHNSLEMVNAQREHHHSIQSINEAHKKLTEYRNEIQKDLKETGWDNSQQNVEDIINYYRMEKELRQLGIEEK